MGKYLYDLYPSDFIPVEHFTDLACRLFTEKERVIKARRQAGLVFNTVMHGRTAYGE
ncbi:MULTISPECIES: hypothetical protein [Rahnella]|jgi:hypothetical protein|uniref:Uncharacterized protein n=1 Tax=Rahnella sp. (strain Y9602) TaxID=2703885 RepID=A0ABW6CD08_RAHSY|nr:MULTISPECIES: hypothetical protein [Rahnella]MBU9863619.1 hypothetical protein [Rahnella aceris]NIA90062.1 hypothetical protein [Rahnella aceris]QQN37797.1 hypothetical protein JHW33_23565 [Rahnella aceris]